MLRVVLILSIAFLWGFGEALVVASSIAPVSSLIKDIGGKNVDVLTVVEAGASPHSYEPKVSQMRKLERAKLYFAIGVEFERAWLRRFQSQNSTLKIIHLDKGIKKIKVGSRENPHIWLSLPNLLIISQKIFDSLVEADPKNSKIYTQNFKKLQSDIKNLHQTISNSLSKLEKGSSFMVFHPSWSYFARDYNLKELPVEVDGKEPKPSQLIKLIKIAKKEHIKTIIAQPEFSTKSANILARELGIEVLKLSPLNPDWRATFETLSKAILKGRS